MQPSWVAQVENRSVFEFEAEITPIKAKIPKLKSAYVNNLVIRNYFFTLFLRDYYLAQYTPDKHKNSCKPYSMTKVLISKQIILV